MAEIDEYLFYISTESIINFGKETRRVTNSLLICNNL